MIYGRDAFTDLRFMDAYVEAQQSDSWDNVQGFMNGTPDGISLGGETNGEDDSAASPSASSGETDQDESAASEPISSDRSATVPEEVAVQPAFLGSKISG